MIHLRLLVHVKTSCKGGRKTQEADLTGSSSILASGTVTMIPCQLAKERLSMLTITR